ncbi:hypothetical protein LMG31506_00246 [Cupriavidus yeoncheonensis]|uniref:Holin of 3TMs, for gene-transfer release n=1 Tax=Cupriavidus yeoncheonensis TaxID=1462994 RepID=A0A916IPH3_9BURK|nr:hypothetical protein [Cupriavidus yeoncheonensis]CAG2126935.1 hypothetical protein LMG31506_00246 [Cupriavidus yeoncheonensis]
MFSAILSFLGGSAFRLIWEQISQMWTAHQEQKHEIERMRLQGDLDAAAHERNLAAIRLQAELGVKTINVQAEADLARSDSAAWGQAVVAAIKPTGIWFVDLWNGIVRPAAATIALGLWCFALHEAGFKMGEWDRELVGVILGFFFAVRVLANRGRA